jgi:phosphoglycolate phosphatase-like HAD superfamily hydrolase
MLCTLCSRPITPVVACDIDGTLGDYHTHFVNFAQQYLGRKLPSVENYQSNRRFAEYLGISLPEYRIIKLAYRQGGMKRSMPIFLGSLSLIKTIHDAGCELWLTTTRPYLRLDGIDPDTRFWLERHGIQYSGLLYDEDKYERLVKTIDRERVVLVIDDLTEQVAAASTYYGHDRVVLCANRHNEWISRSIRFSHRQLERMVEERVVQWRQRLAHKALDTASETV